MPRLAESRHFLAPRYPSSRWSGRGRSSLLALLTLTLGAAATAQERPVGRVEEEMEVVEVLLDVLVTGPHGHVIVGLDEGDFVVEEDGRPVEIESVSFYSNRRLLAGFEEAPFDDTAVPEDRYFVLLFFRPPTAESHDLTLPVRLRKAGRRCLDWIAQDLLPNDYLAVAAFDGGLNLVQDFTLDAARLELAIRLSVTGKAPKKHWPSRTEEPIPGLSLARLVTDDTLRDRTRDLFSAITELALGLGDIAGRKILILLGANFPEAASKAARRGYDPMVEALNTNNVAVYAVDVAGRGRQPTQSRLTRDTGGRYAFHGSNLLAPLKDIARENNGFYLVSYLSTHPQGENGYRKVEIRTTNPELEARTRNGYRYGGRG